MAGREWIKFCLYLHGYGYDPAGPAFLPLGPNYLQLPVYWTLRSKQIDMGGRTNNASQHAGQKTSASLGMDLLIGYYWRVEE